MWHEGIEVNKEMILFCQTRMADVVDVVYVNIVT
jgi:hypothetical protein